MNKWKDIANLFGLELREEFYLDSSDYIYRFDENGLYYKEDCSVYWKKSFNFDELVKGLRKVIKKPGKPHKGELYYTWDGLRVCSNVWYDTAYDYALWKIGNCFESKEDAKTRGKEIIEKIKKEYESK